LEPIKTKKDDRFGFNMSHKNKISDLKLAVALASVYELYPENRYSLDIGFVVKYIINKHHRR
jgi:hypothetical protein